MTWSTYSVKLPQNVLLALLQRQDKAAFVRKLLADALGVEYQEHPRGLAGAKPAVRKRVSKAGVRARNKIRRDK